MNTQRPEIPPKSLHSASAYGELDRQRPTISRLSRSNKRMRDSGAMRGWVLLVSKPFVHAFGVRIVVMERPVSTEQRRAVIIAFVEA